MCLNQDMNYCKNKQNVGKGRRSGRGQGGQGGREPRIKVIVKMRKKKSGGGPIGGGVLGWM